MDTARARRYVAAGCLVAVALVGSGCDVVIGPPPQDVDDPSSTEGY